ncbi:MAG: ABC transporter permease [Acidimicrobiia bacterium]
MIATVEVHDPVVPGASADPTVGAPPRRARAQVRIWVAALWLVGIVVAAAAADVLPLARFERPVGPPGLAPGLRWPEVLGTDNLGRSQLARIVYGARISLGVGAASVTLGLLVGGVLGLLAGYFRGWVDLVCRLLVDTILAFPPLVLLLAITAFRSQSAATLIPALSVLSIPTFTRIARANAMAFSSREFVLAAQALGAPARRVIVRELLPNVVPPVASYTFIVVAAIMVAEGSVSFLGLGIPPPQPSWGGMIAAGRPLLATRPELVFVPAAALLLTIWSLNTLGDLLQARFGTRR